MAKPDSIRYAKEAQQCQLAVKVATFLESYVPPSYYDFTLPDLLHFTNEEALLELRKNSVWQALEREFNASGGLVSEFWDEAEEITPPRTDKPTPTNRGLGLIIATLITSAVIGGSLGWFFPYLNFTPTQVTKTAE
jgi:hypothetical protein